MTFKLLPAQQQAVSNLANGKILIGDVGSGKSITSMAYATSVDPTIKIQVLTTAMKRDSGEWWADAMKMSLPNEMHVDSWNNIKNYVDREGWFFILDEQKLTGTGAWVEAFYKIAKKNKWILLSATPAEVWTDLMPVFIANGFFKNKSEFDRDHVQYARFVKYPKIEKYHDEWHLEDLKKKLYVELPIVKRAKRNEEIINVGFNAYEQKRIWTDRWHIHEDRPLKDAGEMMRLLRKSCNTDIARYETLKALLKRHPKAIVFYNENPELEILRGLSADLGVPVAEWNGHKHEPIPDGDEWVYLVQYLAGREGWNCITTDTVILYSLPYAYRSVVQAYGRVDRLNTPYPVLNLFILKSRAIIDQGIWKSLGHKKDFQAGRFAKKAWPKEPVELRRLN